MQHSCRCHRTMDRKRRKYMARHHDSTESQAQHYNQDTEINDSLYDTGQLVFSFE